MAKVSVVITTFKREKKYLDQAIQSVKSQTVLPLEIILVDDNEAGSSWQIENEKSYSCDPFIKYCSNNVNLGAQISRNRGILAAKGDYIAFLDDDDYWEKTKIEKQMKGFDDLEVGMVFCQGYTVNDCGNKKEVYSSSAVFFENPSFEMLLEKDVIGTTTQALIKKDCFSHVGVFDPAMPARQDYEMWLRISRKFKIVGIKEKLFFHRIHTLEQISKDPEKAVLGYKLLLKKYKSDFKKHSSCVSNQYLKISQIYFRHKKICKCLLYFSKAFIVNPVYIINKLIKKV